MSQLLNSTEDLARPYISTSHEVHPDPTGDGASTLQFFRDNFGFKYEETHSLQRACFLIEILYSGQETVAIMGAHTFGKNHVATSLFRYTWTSRGNTFFNNDYYKMITDETRWYFNDDACTKVGDAHGNRPARRWLANYR